MVIATADVGGGGGRVASKEIVINTDVLEKDLDLLLNMSRRLQTGEQETKNYFRQMIQVNAGKVSGFDQYLHYEFQREIIEKDIEDMYHDSVEVTNRWKTYLDGWKRLDNNLANDGSLSGQIGSSGSEFPGEGGSTVGSNSGWDPSTVGSNNTGWNPTGGTDYPTGMNINWDRNNTGDRITGSNNINYNPTGGSNINWEDYWNTDGTGNNTGWNPSPYDYPTGTNTGWRIDTQTGSNTGWDPTTGNNTSWNPDSYDFTGGSNNGWDPTSGTNTGWNPDSYGSNTGWTPTSGTNTNWSQTDFTNGNVTNWGTTSFGSLNGTMVTNFGSGNNYGSNYEGNNYGSDFGANSGSNYGANGGSAYGAGGLGTDPSKTSVGSKAGSGINGKSGLVGALSEAGNRLGASIGKGADKLASSLSPNGSITGSNLLTAGTVAGLGLTAGGAAIAGGILLGNKMKYYTFTPEDYEALSPAVQEAVLSNLRNAGFDEEKIEMFVNATFRIAAAELNEHIKKIEDAYSNDVNLNQEIKEAYGFGVFEKDKVDKYLLFLAMIIDGASATDEINIYNLINVNLEEDEVDFIYSGLNMEEYMIDNDEIEDEEEDEKEEDVSVGTQAILSELGINE